MNIINLAIDLASEEASVSYPEFIMRATVYPMSSCALLERATSCRLHYTGSLWTRLEYELVDANRAAQVSE